MFRRAVGGPDHARAARTSTRRPIQREASGAAREGAHRDRWFGARRSQAARRAGELLGAATEVTVLAVVTELPGDDAGGIEGSTESPEEAERELRRARRPMPRPRSTRSSPCCPRSWQPHVTRRVEAGDAGPDDRLGRRADGADVIVVGSHGHGVAEAAGDGLGQRARAAPRALPGPRRAAEPPSRYPSPRRYAGGGCDEVRRASRRRARRGRLRSRPTAMRVRVAVDALPMWGSSTVRGAASRRGCTSGSRSNTSSPAAKIVPSSSAVASASSSTTGPRAVFTSTAVGRMSAELAARR